MLHRLVCTGAMAVALAGPAVAQSWDQRSQYNQGYQQPQNQYGQQGYQQPQNQYGYGQYGSGQSGNGYGSAYGSRTQQDREERRQDRREARDLALDVDNALKAHGYNVGAVNGGLDTESRAAIRAYERDAGLPITGQPTQQLLAHIESNNIRPGGGGLGATAGQAVERFLGQQFGTQSPGR